MPGRPNPSTDRKPAIGEERVTGSRIVAKTVSRTVWEWLRRGPIAGRVLATFDHACDLLIPGDRIVALVTHRVPVGPLNVVVAGRSGVFAGIAPDDPAALAEHQIRAGTLTVSLKRAAVWEPRPDWASLGACRSAIVARLPGLRTLCLERGPAGSLLELLGTMPPNLAVPKGTHAAAWTALEALAAGWAGDLGRLHAGATRLAGLGGGLTPSGDDFLAGLMLWAWLAHPFAEELCHLVTEAAGGLTTTLSAALLRSASLGECSAAWHVLLDALSRGSGAEIAPPLDGVLAHGATSGADALAGFLWAGLSLPAPAAPGISSQPLAAFR